MSQAPNNPFDAQGDQFGQPAKKESKTWLWVLGIIGGIFLLGALACCGAGYFMWSKASGLVAEAMVEEYGDNPVIVEKIGEISSSEFNLGATGTETSKDENTTAVVLEITGDKGSGQLIQKTDNSTGEVTVVLVVDGEEFPLELVDEYEDIEGALEGFEDFEAMEEELSVDESESNDETPAQ